ncbi:MAG TPA: flagellar hook-associated protein 3 [Deltaproteobacteria bacterium]|nr:flagellar hook-associated protein 3 [Deltaproteobacteria bacterium]
MMAMRVSDNTRFDTMINNLFAVQDRYNQLMDKMSSQKNINRPSDDPPGMGRVMKYRETQAAVTSYTRNVDSANAWITMSESKLTSVNNLLVRAKEIALAQSSGTANALTREQAAVEIEQIFDEIKSLANSKYGDRYLFAGTKMDQAPFSSTASAATIGTALTADDNSFDGTVASGGSYSGSVNKTYAVKIVSSGAFGAATYQVSEDGGKNWGGVTTMPVGGNITLGDGIDLTFTAGTTDLTTNDIFYVHASAEGYYHGNGEELFVEIGKEITFSYSISGQSIFTDKGKGDVDIFATLENLKTALLNNAPNDVAAQIDNLDAAGKQVNKCIARCGAKANRLEVAENNLSDLYYKLTELISKTEDVDIADITTKFSMQQIVLQASYAMAARIGNISILDFLR